MEIHGLFTESETDDYVARMSAVVVHKQIAWWLHNNEDHLGYRMLSTTDGGFILRSSDFDMDEDYPDLLVAFMPESTMQVQDGYGARASFGADGEGFFEGKKTIILRLLDGPHDTTNLTDRFRSGFKTHFVHEFQHYLMTRRRPQTGYGSLDKRKSFGLAAYFNDADETNAYYQEAVHDVVEFFTTVRSVAPQKLTRFSDMTTLELVKWAKSEWFDDGFLSHASPKTTQALNKRLYRFFEEWARPMFATVLKNFQP